MPPAVGSFDEGARVGPDALRVLPGLDLAEQLVASTLVAERAASVLDRSAPPHLALAGLLLLRLPAGERVVDTTVDLGQHIGQLVLKSPPAAVSPPAAPSPMIPVVAELQA
ncbi:hypothetical protein [Actinomycetospora lemnae]|uniref:Uncharacterized protein n=1 Tax=Actinomycetospora lemnae TaxID=3019891 RepID=A0ABT5SUM7_9PSEU|nr:hypothetical protein [Actinomycetospora sp. DW7H6]MDD7966563.1 hypothetical protein [Actinomycetospora sp. DW7H6]